MLRLDSLRVKLALALALTVAVAVFTLTVAVNHAASNQFTSYVMSGALRRAEALAPTLVDYYEQRGGWEGVGAALTSALWPQASQVRNRNGAPGHGAGPFGAPGGLVLADDSGRVIYDGTNGAIAETSLSPAILGKGIPLEANGQTVGYLLPAKGPNELAFEEQLNRSILYAGLAAGVVAIVLGALLTRAIMRPLSIVEEGARRIADGDLSHRVRVNSRDEIGDLARQFNEMAEALQRQESLRRAMVADIAHELRTPLTVIRGQVEALQDNIFELSQENIQPIHDQVLLLGRLVEDLRELALAEAGALPMERIPVALYDVVRRAVAAFQQRAGEQGVNIHTQLQAEVPAIEGDPQRIEQVLANLLSNAMRYTPSGGSVTIKLTADSHWAYISVTDTGSGIAPEDLPYVFDRFYRADAARAKATGGSGLGLSIAKQIVEAHGGAITVQSSLGVGTTFTVRLPIMRDGAKSAADYPPRQ